MDLTKLAIHRPYAVAVGFLIAILLGLFSLSRLPIDLMPDITYPTLTVSTEYTGVGPEEIETLITRPVEDAVSAVQGLEDIVSTSQEGQSQVRLSFRWGTDLDSAAEDLRARLDRIRNRLPEEASPPTVFKFDMSAMPVIHLGISGQLSPFELKKLAEDQIKPRIERLPGVASLDIRGGLDREIRVEVDKSKLAALGLTLDQVMAALARENLTVSAGEVRPESLEIGVRVAGEFKRLDEISSTPILVKMGNPVLVRDFAVVVDGYQEVKQAVTIDGVPSIMLSVRKQSGANTVQVADAVTREVALLNRDLGSQHGISVSVTNDTSRFIKRAIHHLTNDLLMGSVLAVLVLLFFLRNLRSTLIVATAIPVSVVATFALLYFQNFTLNTMSLGGLALGIGRLVDDSIVVIENIFRHRQMGKDAKTAALEGTKQVSLAIVASTATTLAVFVPLIFLTGMTGVMFKQLSLVVVFALSCSLVVAQGLIPMLSARFLKDEAPVHPVSRRRYGSVGGVLGRIETGYARSLAWALKHSRVVMGGALAAILVGVALFPLLGTEFMPTSDEGEVQVNVEMAVGTPLETLGERVRQLETLLRKEVPEIEVVIAQLGGTGNRSNGPHTASLRAVLVSSAERKRSSTNIALSLRRKLAGVPGVVARVTASGGNPMARFASSDAGKIGVQVRGYDLETAKRLMQAVQEVMDSTPGLADVRASREAGRPETVIRIDRAKAASLGLSVTEVARALEAAVLGRRATYYRDGGDEYAVMVRLQEDQRLQLENVLDLQISGASGRLVPLREVVLSEFGEGPTRIEREDQQRVINVTGEIESRDLGGLVKRLREGLHSIPVPGDFSLVITGDYEEQQKSFNELALALSFALVLVFLVMVAQFESLVDPLAIFFSVPACVIGVVLALLLTKTTMNVQSFIGIIVLVGIAVSNGIVMIDYIKQLRREVSLEEAIYEGAKLRLRPVLMTTATTILAMIPMALGLGEGGELQSPMARVVIGGLLTSTGITLYLVPIVYRWLNRRTAKKAEAGMLVSP